MVKEYKAEVWYPIDILIDWEKQKVAVFINSTFKETTIPHITYSINIKS